MSTYNWLQLFGIPSICGAITLCIATYVWKQFKSIKALKLGLQALLRDRIYQLFNYCNNKGFANQSERENFNNMYQQYHSLGANGVMDDTKTKFFNLPYSNETRQ